MRSILRLSAFPLVRGCPLVIRSSLGGERKSRRVLGHPPPTVLLRVEKNKRGAKNRRWNKAWKFKSLVVSPRDHSDSYEPCDTGFSKIRKRIRVHDKHLAAMGRKNRGAGLRPVAAVLSCLRWTGTVLLCQCSLLSMVTLALLRHGFDPLQNETHLCLEHGILSLKLLHLLS